MAAISFLFSYLVKNVVFFIYLVENVSSFIYRYGSHIFFTTDDRGNFSLFFTNSKENTLLTAAAIMDSG